MLLEETDPVLQFKRKFDLSKICCKTRHKSYGIWSEILSDACAVKPIFMNIVLVLTGCNNLEALGFFFFLFFQPFLWDNFVCLQVVDSSTGPGENLRDALWETGNTMNQTHLLWYDNGPKWAAGVAYRWRILHDPDSGRIRVRWYRVSFEKFCDEL